MKELSKNLDLSDYFHFEMVVNNKVGLLLVYKKITTKKSNWIIDVNKFCVKTNKREINVHLKREG